MTDRGPDCDVVVVGAGLSGLTCASLLCDAGLDTIVLEAAERTGGRIHSVKHASDGSYVADLGPTWVWPAYQPIVTAWLDRLNVETFNQFESGDAVLDLDETAPGQRQLLPGQHGIRRLHGGPQALIDTLHGRLPHGIVRTGHPVTAIDADANGVVVTAGGAGAEDREFHATGVIVAAPLRLAAQAISWPGSLDKAVLAAMAATPTWMAAQTKAVFLYDRPFWRSEGLSGRVASRPGPLAEVHDHSSEDGHLAALFGFVGWPPAVREAHPEALREEITRQMVRCFGDRGGAYSALHIEDWAMNRAICSELDLTRPAAHPEVTPDILRAPHCDGRLFFAVAETALQSPGLIEGAFCAAQCAVAGLTTTLHET